MLITDKNSEAMQAVEDMCMFIWMQLSLQRDVQSDIRCHGRVRPSVPA